MSYRCDFVWSARTWCVCEISVDIWLRGDRSALRLIYAVARLGYVASSRVRLLSYFHPFLSPSLILINPDPTPTDAHGIKTCNPHISTVISVRALICNELLSHRINLHNYDFILSWQVVINLLLIWAGHFDVEDFPHIKSGSWEGDDEGHCSSWLSIKQ